MAVSYKRLWKLLVDKEMSKSDLRKKAEIAPNTMTKLRRDEEVNLTILSKICKTLHADFGDIVEYVPDAEIWDLYNENRELLGKDHVRGEQLPIDGYHLVVHVWIRNSKGEYLISQRSANRPTYPLMWECVGGSVVKGEDSLQGAIREAKEEVGVDLMPKNGQVLFTKTRKIIEGKIFNDIMDVWLFDYDGDASGNMRKTYDKAVSAITNIEEGMKQRKKHHNNNKENAGKTVIVLLAILFSLFNVAESKAADKVTDSSSSSYKVNKAKADEAYLKGDYQKAIGIYEELHLLFFNMSSRHFNTSIKCIFSNGTSS